MTTHNLSFFALLSGNISKIMAALSLLLKPTDQLGETHSFFCDILF